MNKWIIIWPIIIFPISLCDFFFIEPSPSCRRRQCRSVHRSPEGVWQHLSPRSFPHHFATQSQETAQCWAWLVLSRVLLHIVNSFPRNYGLRPLRLMMTILATIRINKCSILALKKQTRLSSKYKVRMNEMLYKAT